MHWIFLYIDCESKIVYLPFEYNYLILARVLGMIILKQLNGKAIWLLDTLNQDSIEKKLARMYSTAYVNFVLCRQVYWIKVYMHVEYSQAISNLYS